MYDSFDDLKLTEDGEYVILKETKVGKVLMPLTEEIRVILESLESKDDLIDFINKNL